MIKRTQTRGRPKKNPNENLPPISRKLFPQHCAVFYTSCMVYVLEAFLKTKHERRIGHSQGGFTIYERLHQDYCFENVQVDCRLWGLQAILQKPRLVDFVKLVNGCAPKFVFKEILLLIEEIIGFLENQSIQSTQNLEQKQYKLWSESQNEIDRKYKYIRFTHSALKQLRMQKWDAQVSIKIRDLWIPFIRIVSYSIFCILNGIQQNKYLKPFFSDAQNPEKTIIGQLNLKQIVDFEDSLSTAKQVKGFPSSEGRFRSPDRKRNVLSFSNQQENKKSSPERIDNLSPENELEDNPRNCHNMDYSPIQIRKNSNLRPIRLITHHSNQFSEDGNHQIQKQMAFSLLSPIKVNLESNENGCLNPSIISSEQYGKKRAVHQNSTWIVDTVKIPQLDQSLAVSQNKLIKSRSVQFPSQDFTQIGQMCKKKLKLT